MFDESPSESWNRRYGSSASSPPSELPARLLAHRSVRNYSEAPISEQTMRWLIAAAQSSATSSNLQLWSVISVQERDRRAAIAELCADQDQVRDASWFLCFIVDHFRIREVAKEVGEECLGLDYNEYYTMALVDVALAAERLVCAAESTGIGICYIGALRNSPSAVAELLELPDGTFGVFGLCLGYPADDCSAVIKPRLSQDKVWFREKYDREVEVGDYDERMKAFNDSQNLKVDVAWSMRSGRRVDEHHLSGRDVLKDFLGARGLDKR